MAWVSYQRIVEGSTLSGKFGESMRCVEKWSIRTDSPATSKADILGGVTATIGVTYGTAHFEIPALLAMEFDLSPDGRDGMRWTLTVSYYTPTPDKKPTENGIPEDVWEYNGGTTTVPAIADKDGNSIVNSAGDPLEGFEKEREEVSWTLTKYYEDDTSLNGDVNAFAGRINENAWAGGDPFTWKCYFKGAKKISISRLDGDADGGQLDFIESRWEFRYAEDTWNLLPWDVGFMELGGGSQAGRKAILGTDKKPVKQPVALNPDGSAAADGTPPAVCNGGDGFQLYEAIDWDAALGTPEMVP